jgi:hypothetical protein
MEQIGKEAESAMAEYVRLRHEVRWREMGHRLGDSVGSLDWLFAHQGDQQDKQRNTQLPEAPLPPPLQPTLPVPADSLVNKDIKTVLVLTPPQLYCM